MRRSQNSQNCLMFMKQYPELQQKWTSWKDTCDDQVCTPYFSLQYQLHLALYPTGLVQHSNPYTRLHHQLQSQPQSVAQGQLSATSTQAIQQLPVAPQQQSLLLQPPVPGSHVAPMQQGQPQFVQPRVNPSGNKGNPHHLGKVLTLWLSLSSSSRGTA